LGVLEAEKDDDDVMLNDNLRMDASIMPTTVHGFSLVQTTDFFYPLIDDPYTMGKIACANVLSDLYAHGVTSVTNMLMLLGLSTQWPENLKRPVTLSIMRGFRDAAREAGTIITGGQTVRNPWCIIGGVASAVVPHAEVIKPTGARPGDVLVLTKPLGTQTAVLAYGKLFQPHHPFKGMEEIVKQAHATAIASMVRLNKNAALLMHRFCAKAATDVTGFGLMGHAKVLVENQEEKVTFHINVLPVIRGTPVLDAMMTPKLLSGKEVETSGGLLVILPKVEAEAYCKALEALDGWPALIIGEVVEADERHVQLNPQPMVFEVNGT